MIFFINIFIITVITMLLPSFSELKVSRRIKIKSCKIKKSLCSAEGWFVVTIGAERKEKNRTERNKEYNHGLAWGRHKCRHAREEERKTRRGRRDGNTFIAFTLPHFHSSLLARPPPPPRKHTLYPSPRQSYTFPTFSPSASHFLSMVLSLWPWRRYERREASPRRSRSVSSWSPWGAASLGMPLWGGLRQTEVGKESVKIVRWG